MDGSPAVLDRVTSHSWRDMWEAVASHAAEEAGMEVRCFGPVVATAARSFPTERGLNRVLGAGEPRAAEEGHLREAIAWLRSNEVEYVVPVPAQPRSCKAAAWLTRREFEPGERSIRFVRDTCPLSGGEELAIEIHRLRGESDGDGFCRIPDKVFGLEPASYSLLFSLPARDAWRCYTAVDLRASPQAAACGAMFIENGVAQLAFDATILSARQAGLHQALVRHRIFDAAMEGCHTMVAEVSLAPSAEAVRRSLVKAGFTPAYGINSWQRPGLEESDPQLPVGHWPSV